MKGNKKVASALDISQYLLSLDPKRKYFTTKVMSSEEGWGINPPVEGNFRLNKLLHILQILHYVKYGELLFSEDMIAYKNGAVVESVIKSFSNELVKLKTYPKVSNVCPKQKEFISLIYNHFQGEYTNYELGELSHDDPSWQIAQKEGYKTAMSREEDILKYWKDFYQHVLEEIEEE